MDPSTAASGAPGADERTPGRWGMLALLSVSQLLGMSLWFAGNAVAPALVARWGLGGSEVAGLTTAVQLGFVAGTALIAILNLADVVPARWLFTVCAVAGAAANAWLLAVDGYAGALASRLLAGMCLAGVYPPAMKMASTWFRARRGVAVGTVVGALTVGKAGPYLLVAFPEISDGVIVASASLAALLAAALVWIGYRDGPFAFPAPRFSWGLIGEVWGSRRYRLALGGYLGHMAELYSYWTWIPAFIAASAAARGEAMTPGLRVLAFGTVAIGGAGCVWGGLMGDRIGRARLTIGAMAVSGASALLVALSFGGSWWVLGPLALIWGFFVIADSAQFSVLVTESVPPYAVGTALALQVSLGFLLTTLTIQLIPPLVENAGWGSAFGLLAVGPMLGIMAMWRLMRLTDGPRQEG
jgi:MFS family permease